MVSLATLMDFGEQSMKKLCFACLLFLLISNLWSEKRFDRPVIEVSNPKTYQSHQMDDVEYPTLSNARYEVSCIAQVSRHQYYNVEIANKNNSVMPLSIPTSFVTIVQDRVTPISNRLNASCSAAGDAGGEHFVPDSLTYEPPTYHTTVDATATPTAIKPTFQERRQRR